MTPPRVDAEIVHRRLRAMEEALGSLAQMRDTSSDDLRTDPIARAAAERFLQVLTDLAVGVNVHLVTAVLGRAPESGASSFDDAAAAGIIGADLAAALRQSVGLRNVLVHQYIDIDLPIVATSIGLALDGYPRYIAAVASWLTHRAG